MLLQGPAQPGPAQPSPARPGPAQRVTTKCHSIPTTNLPTCVIQTDN